MSYQKFRQIWLGGQSSNSSHGSTDPRWDDESSIADRRTGVLLDADAVDAQVRSSMKFNRVIRSCSVEFWNCIRRNGGQYTWEAHRILQDFRCWDINEPGKHKTAIMYMLFSERLTDKEKQECLINYFCKQTNASLLVSRLPDHEEYGDDRGLTIIEIAARRRMYFFFETIRLVTGIRTPLMMFSRFSNALYLPHLKDTKLLDIAVERTDRRLVKLLLPKAIVKGQYRDVHFNEPQLKATLDRCFDQMSQFEYIHKHGHEEWFVFVTFVKSRIPSRYVEGRYSFSKNLDLVLDEFQFVHTTRRKIERDTREDDAVTFMWT